MKALFREIRAGDIRAVTARLDADDALVGAIATAPPKKDDGQSTLQVAIKAGQFEVARLLLERGADVNFMESSDLNAWRTPVLHDAIRAAVLSTRLGRNRALLGQGPRTEIMNTAEASAHAFDILAALVARGADPRALDSAGNPALMRAVLDAKQIIDEPIVPELVADLERIFELLIRAGSSPDWIDQRFGRSIAEKFTDEPVGRFLTKR